MRTGRKPYRTVLVLQCSLFPIVLPLSPCSFQHTFSSVAVHLDCVFQTRERKVRPCCGHGSYLRSILYGTWMLLLGDALCQHVCSLFRGKKKKLKKVQVEFLHIIYYFAVLFDYIYIATMKAKDIDNFSYFYN